MIYIMKKETIYWMIIVFFLGLYFIMSLKNYGTENLQVKTRIERAKCIIDMKRSFPQETNYEVCEDIAR